MGKPEKIVIRCSEGTKSRFYGHASLQANNEEFLNALLDVWENREEDSRPVTA